MSSKRSLSELCSSDEETQHEPEKKQPKTVIDSTMDEEDIAAGDTVESGTKEQSGPTPGVETKASK